ncbi:MAG: J domain-containing protein, partial [Firmicutes bacterium]|nr:J domain-containing protein [Bacillota bacterium]
MIWAILGIDETKDKKAITRAYRDKLQTVNPEEKPEQFKQLRAAYEEALRLADEGEAKNEPQTACQRWLAKAKAVYNDLPCRLSVDCWKELLADDFCQGIDTRMEAEEALLGFFHTSYRLPQRVWQYLDGEFSWQERMSELYEIYEKDFVDYVIAGGLRTGTGEILELFAPGTDGTKVDDYVSLVVRLSSLPFEEWQQPYETLKALKVRNPYGDSLCLRYDHYRGDESAVERMALLADLYPESLQVLLQGALLSREAGRNGDAIRYCEKAAAIDMDLPWAHEIWAYSLADQGDYRGAVRKLNVVMGLSDGNQKRLYELNELRIQWSDHLLQSYRHAVEDDPNDADALFELCWCYVQRDEDDAAAALADRLKEDFPDRFSYHNLMSILTTITCEWEKSLKHIDQVLQAIGQMDPAGTEEEVRRIRRASEFETRRARVLLSMDRKEEAYAMFDQIA